MISKHHHTTQQINNNLNNPYNPINESTISYVPKNTENVQRSPNKNNNNIPILEPQQCLFHTHQIITNFCRESQCLMPLCPDCITQHLEMHKNNGEFAVLESIEKTTNDCHNIVSQIESQFTEDMQNIQDFKSQKINMHENLKKKLQTIRAKVNQIVDNFFNQLQGEFSEYLENEGEVSFNELNSVETFIGQKLNEAIGMKNKLGSSKYLKYLVRILNSDFMGENNHYHKECEQFIEVLNKKNLDLETDENKLYTLNLELAKYVTIKNSQFYQRKPKNKTTYYENKNLYSQQQIPSPQVQQNIADNTSKVFHNNNNEKFSLNQNYNNQGKQGVNSISLISNAQAQSQNINKNYQGQNQNSQLLPQSTQQQQQRYPSPSQHRQQQIQKSQKTQEHAELLQQFGYQPVSASNQRRGNSQSKKQQQKGITVDPFQNATLLQQQSKTQQYTPINRQGQQYSGSNAIIEQSDYFEGRLNEKFLHYFSLEKKQFCFINLENHLNYPQYYWEQLDLNIPFQIPFGHKSLQTPTGKILLTGGYKAQGIADDKTYQLDLKQRKLIELPTMINGRAEHGMIYINNSIYVLGGKNNGGAQLLESCEYLSLENIDRANYSAQWRQVSPLKNGVFDFSYCIFDNKYICVFGRNQNKQNVALYYDPKFDQWKNIHLDVDENIELDFRYKSGAQQINRNQIIVFGGNLDRNDIRQRQKERIVNYILTLNSTFVGSNQLSFSLTYLPLEQGLNTGDYIINSQIIMHGNKVYTSPIFELDEKNKLAIYDGINWRIE